MKKIVLILSLVFLLSSCYGKSSEMVDNIEVGTGDIISELGDITPRSDLDLIGTGVVVFTEDKRLILDDTTIGKFFYQDDLLGDIMQQIDLNDFKNMKLLKSEGQVDSNGIKVEGEVLDVIFQNLIAAKAFNEKKISYCDKTDYFDATGNSYGERCKADYYLLDLLVNNNYKLCKDFNDIYKDMGVMGLNMEPKDVCNEFVDLLKNDNLNDKDIENTLKVLYDTDNLDSDILNLFKAVLLKTDTCGDIEVISSKLVCLNIYNNGDIFTDFKNKIYNKLIETEYLYN